ncbi:oligogalacturonate lyase family protein [Edaphobacter sp.]|uniref:oligogalacturonate lyase family protein n=1 Tax=Edaphobacter sp. TaxID=1934404 RepID=UPI002DB6026C|nr:oligogalacturonate lyase family protein [Edaphobacter sp.]HEU5340147.1 oligogalacturonate lyase family protein [Edaphobacter sp.]
MPTLMRFAASALAIAAALPLAQAQNPAGNQTKTPPVTWVDKDTGHRVWRLSTEPNSGGFYFNVNAYTPDEKQMIYTAPDGIHVLDLATRKTKLLVPNPPRSATATDQRGFRLGNVHALVVGHKTNSVFFTKTDPTTRVTSVYKADTNSGAVRKLIDLPPRMNIVSVNADETLAAGTYIEGDATGKEYGSNLPATAGKRTDNRVANANQGPHYQPESKGLMMERRLAARLPLVLFTIRLEPGPNGEKPGTVKILLHSTDWVNHLLFSPTDPTLLMYCHEGPWQKVDRIWMIHTDGTHNTLIHKRTMYMEIAGHEFWGLDGKTIWYDWQYPKGEDFFLAGYNLETGKRTAYHMQRNEWSIHFNLTKDLDLFCGDGGDPGQVAHAKDGEWIELFHPQMITGDSGALNDPSFWQPGVFHAEHLVNMSHHYYREEPNVRFSPDKKLVIFTSNMFGPSYVFGAEVQKAVNPPAADVVSTPDLARKYNPVNPPDSKTPMPRR